MRWGGRSRNSKRASRERPPPRRKRRSRPADVLVLARPLRSPSFRVGPSVPRQVSREERHPDESRKIPHRGHPRRSPSEEEVDSSSDAEKRQPQRERIPPPHRPPRTLPSSN